MRPFLLSLAQGPAAQAPVDYTFSFPLVSTSRDARKSRATRSMEIRFTFCFRFQYVKDPRHLSSGHLPSNVQWSMVNIQCLVWKPEGLDLSAGPVPVFPMATT